MATETETETETASCLDDCGSRMSTKNSDIICGLSSFEVQGRTRAHSLVFSLSSSPSIFFFNGFFFLRWFFLS